MNITNLPSNIIIYISLFLKTPDIIRLRGICRFFRDIFIYTIAGAIEKISNKKIFYLDISNMIINLPQNIKALEIYNYANMKMIKGNLPETIVVGYLSGKYINYSLLNTKKLYINSSDEYIDLGNLDKVEKLYTQNRKINFPKNVNNINFVKRFTKTQSNYLNLGDINIILPYNLRVLKINDYSQLNMVTIPSFIDTIIVKTLYRGYINFNKLNIENLHIINVLCGRSDEIKLKELDNVKNLYLYNNNINYSLPKNLKNLYCNSLYDNLINLDYLECEYFNVDINSYIKTIKLVCIYSSYYYNINIPKCDKLLISKEKKCNIAYSNDKPKIVEYY